MDKTGSIVNLITKKQSLRDAKTHLQYCPLLGNTHLTFPYKLSDFVQSKNEYLNGNVQHL